MPKKYLVILPVFIILLFSGCSQNILPTSQAMTKTMPPVKIATFYADKFDGSFTAGGLGKLAIIDNCLVLSNENKNLLLILRDKSYTWDNKKQVLTFQNTQYKIGDELYLGGGGFAFNSPHLPMNQIDNKQCHFDWVWLAS